MGVAYIPVAKVGEIQPGGMKAADMGGRRVLVCNVDGEYFVCAADCPHEGADLQEGELSGTRIRCDNHNYMYDLRTGECVLPRGGPQLSVLPVEHQGDDICVRLEW
jgi:3-phenylpropionate/trans-cinnamate dioxygenase ferredoxin subunit